MRMATTHAFRNLSRDKSMVMKANPSKSWITHAKLE